MENPQIKRVLISVSNKLGIVDFAKSLEDKGIEIVSTGGTRRHLEASGVRVTDVAEYTGFPEMMDGRLKTLHPKIFGGILCRHNLPADMESIQEHGILPFEMVVVNLYPFEETIRRSNVLTAEAIEQIDIGGPSLVRAAAKNSSFVTVVTSPLQYADVLEEVLPQGCTTNRLRRVLMAQAFQHTANYDRTIAEYFSGETEGEEFPSTMQLVLRRHATLRYGENSHQSAALYSLEDQSNSANVVNARQLNGKQLSYNNLIDLDAALGIVRYFESPACSVIKHTNPCGAAIADDLRTACENAFQGDPVSAFGSVVGFNRPIDDETARFLVDGDLFVEAIVAPDFAPTALELITTKAKWKKNVRLLKVGQLSNPNDAFEFQNVFGGMLVQSADIAPDPKENWKVVTEQQPDAGLQSELEFGWSIVRFVKSNAITLSKNLCLCGVGAGQMSRVDSVEIAIRKAKEEAEGSILASDAFFPFPDSIEIAAKAGIRAIIQPGGSVRDQEVIDACNQYGIPMIFVGNRHFRH